MLIAQARLNWENKKIAGANFCTDRQTMEIFRSLLFDFQKVNPTFDLCQQGESTTMLQNDGF